MEDETDPVNIRKCILEQKISKSVMARQFLRLVQQLNVCLFSFAGLTLSNLRKSLLEGTLEAIMWTPKWGSPGVAVFLLVEVIFT